jgi:hypothetical protein
MNGVDGLDGQPGSPGRGTPGMCARAIGCLDVAYRGVEAFGAFGDVMCQILPPDG